MRLLIRACRMPCNDAERLFSRRALIAGAERLWLIQNDTQQNVGCISRTRKNRSTVFFEVTAFIALKGGSGLARGPYRCDAFLCNNASQQREFKLFLLSMAILRETAI